MCMYPRIHRGEKSIVIILELFASYEKRGLNNYFYDRKEKNCSVTIFEQ